jgi:hypothetical protein
MNVGSIKDVEECVVYLIAHVREGNIFVGDQFFEGLAWVIRNKHQFIEYKLGYGNNNWIFELGSDIWVTRKH